MMGTRTGKVKTSTFSTPEKLKKASSQQDYLIKNIPADGIIVRFLSEPNEWQKFTEVYIEAMEGYVIVGEGERYEGNGSERYLAPAVDRATKKVIALKIPKSLVNKLATRWDRRNTVCDRDYELSKEGTGKNTEYDLEADEPSNFNPDRYVVPDLLDILQQVHDEQLEKYEAFMAGDSDDDEDRPKRRRSKPTSRPRRARDEDDDDDDEDDEDDEVPDDDEDEDEDEPPRRSSRPAKRAVKKAPPRRRIRR